MTIYDNIVSFDKELMIQFLLRFADDTINQFGRFQLPSEENIRNFLDIECSEEFIRKYMGAT